MNMQDGSEWFLETPEDNHRSNPLWGEEMMDQPDWEIPLFHHEGLGIPWNPKENSVSVQC